MVGVAVKVTLLPEHTGLLPVVIAAVTLGVTNGFTVMVIPEDVAVVGDAQVAVEVMVTVITSVLMKSVPPTPA